jgi:hypothetical protein
MAVFLISYDINEKDAFEYDNLWAALKQLGASKILYSEWVVTGGTRESIYSALSPYVQDKYRLLVLELKNNGMWNSRLMISDDKFIGIMGSASS